MVLMTDSRGLRRIAENIIVLRDGSEQVAERKLSPTLVARIIRQFAIKWKFLRIQVFTESRLENIARECRREFSRVDHRFGVVRILNSQTVPKDFSLRDFDGKEMLLFLLTPKLLADVFNKTRIRKLVEHGMGTGQNRIIIVGRCLPSFIRRYKVLQNLRIMIYPLRTDNWINGKEVTENLTIHSIHRQSKKTWKTLLFMSSHSNKLLEASRNNKGSLFGILKNIFIYVDVFPVRNIVDTEDGTLSGIFGKIMTYLIDYLQISIYFRNYLTNDEYDNFGRIEKRRTDLHIGIFPIQQDSFHAYLPPLYYDVLTLHGMKIYRPFSFDVLLSILKQDVWITLILVILTSNLCYYLAHDNSPSLRYHPRIKNNSFGKFWRILFFDSLIRFQLEWQQGPNLSTRWLNTTLSFLSFMSACYYLPLFTGKLLSDRTFFPYTDAFDYCDINNPNVFLSRDLVTYSIFYGCIDIRKVSCISSRYDFKINAVELIEKAKRGEVYIIAGGIYGQEKFQHFPNITHLKTSICRKQVSMGALPDCIIFNIASNLILKIREAGLLQALQIRYMTSYPADIQIPKAMTFSETWFTFVILGIGLSMTLLILIVERFVKQ